jgi:hypothetical protein
MVWLVGKLLLPNQILPKLETLFLFYLVFSNLEPRGKCICFCSGEGMALVLAVATTKSSMAGKIGGLYQMNQKAVPKA